MKKLLILLFAVTFSSTVLAEAQLKEVCHDKLGKDGKPVVDKKTGKPAQDCKTIKVHKKLEGTEIPPKK
jgi:hypothetical protein